MSDSVARASSLLSIVALVACGSAGGRPGPAAAGTTELPRDGQHGISECGPTRRERLREPRSPGRRVLPELRRRLDHLYQPGLSQRPREMRISSRQVRDHGWALSSVRERGRRWMAAAGPGSGATTSTLHGGSGIADSTTPGRYETGWDRSLGREPRDPRDRVDEQLAMLRGNADVDPRRRRERGSADHVRRLVRGVRVLHLGRRFSAERSGVEPTAATGGSRSSACYPWSVPPSSMSIDCQARKPRRPESLRRAPPQRDPESRRLRVSRGDGRKWGQADLAGNAWEWTLDFYADYAPASADGANLDTNELRVIRGGAFDYHSTNLLACRSDTTRPDRPQRRPGSPVRALAMTPNLGQRLQNFHQPMSDRPLSPFGRCGRIRSGHQTSG